MTIAEQKADGCGLMVDVTDSQLDTETEQRMRKKERKRENGRNVPDRAPQANIQNASTLWIVQNKSIGRFNKW